jgi:hypothetical protein
MPWPEPKDRDDIPLLLEGESRFKLVWMESTSPCNSLIGKLPLVEVTLLRQYMNRRSQMQGGKNWSLQKEINANRFF